jgi:glucose-1-phosphate thymidylyltransferase
MKGIVLAGGQGSRLFPITLGISKQLVPIFDKPMIYYPISVLMLAGIRDILIISDPQSLPNYKKLLGNGNQLGVNFSYKIQERPSGLPEAFIIGEDFIEDDNVALILGDNIFYGSQLSGSLNRAKNEIGGGTCFAYQVSDARDFGVVEFNSSGGVVSIEEKPANPKSNYAITGLYYFDKRVCEISRKLQPSNRGELEIVDVLRAYLNTNELDVEQLGRGFTWLDTGTPENLHKASSFVETVQTNQGFSIGALEEIALRQNWISELDLSSYLDNKPANSYFNYLRGLI